jgi:hypothetical protein
VHFNVNLIAAVNDAVYIKPFGFLVNIHNRRFHIPYLHAYDRTLNNRRYNIYKYRCGVRMRKQRFENTVVGRRQYLYACRQFSHSLPQHQFAQETV